MCFGKICSRSLIWPQHKHFPHMSKHYSRAATSNTTTLIREVFRKTKWKFEMEFSIKGTVPKKIRYVFLFHSHSYGLKWPWVNFLSFWGSNSTQISIFEVKYLRDPTMTPQHERCTRTLPTNTKVKPHHERQHPPPREAPPKCVVWWEIWCRYVL